MHRPSRAPQRAIPRACAHHRTTPMTMNPDLIIPISTREALPHEDHDPARRALRPAPDRHPRGLHPQRRPGALRRAAARQGRRDRAARHRHGDRPARPARGRGRPRGRRRAAGAAARRRRPRAARRRVSLELRAAEQDVEIVARLGDVPHPHAAPRRTSRRSRSRRATARRGPGRRVRRDRAQGRPLGVARRDAPGAHRHPRLGRRRASCGWSPPTPTGCRSRRRKLEAPLAGLVRGQRAGAGAAGADADRPARPSAESLARLACAPTRSCSRPAASCCRRG